MKMNTRLVWRLSKLPTPEEISKLVNDKIITQEEAREMLFSSETEEDRDKKSLESEIKFLRDLVEKLSNNRSQIITTIREIEVPYQKYLWYGRYDNWCSTCGAHTEGIDIALNANATIGNFAGCSVNFSDIKTF